MPSGKHNLRTARARDLNCSLINIASSRDVPFYQPQQLQSLHHGATFVPLWSPIPFSKLHKVMICSRHVMASVQDVKIAEALLILCLAYYALKRVRNCWNWGVMPFYVSRYGVSVFSIFSVMAGWIAEILFILFFAYIAVKRTEHSWVRSVLAYGCSSDSSLRRPPAILSCKALCAN